MRMIALAAAVCLAVLVGVVPAAQTAAGTLTGSVKDPRGAAMAGVTVQIAARGSAPRRVLTDARGEFTFQGLAAGDYTLTATLAGFTPFTTVVSVSAKPARVAIVLQVSELAKHSQRHPRPRSRMSRPIVRSAETPRARRTGAGAAAVGDGTPGRRVPSPASVSAETALQHRDLRPHRRQRVPARHAGSAVHVLDRRRHRVVLQRAPLPERRGSCRRRTPSASRR